MATKIEDRYAHAGALGDDLGAWLEGARRHKTALAIVDAAGQREPEILRLREAAVTLRNQATASLRALPATAPAEAKYEGWDLEDRAAEKEREASLLEVEWLQQLRGALEVVPELPEAHRRLGWGPGAGRPPPPHPAPRAAPLLRSHDRGWHTKFLAGNGAVTLITDPPGAKVTAYRYVEERRRLVPKKHAELGLTPIREAPLPHGSYLLVAELEGRPPVRYPVLIERAEHWDGVPPDESEPEPIRILTADEIGVDFVYVPAGGFLSGGDPMAGDSLPRRRIWAGAALAQRHPVTNGEYLRFLTALAREDEDVALVPRKTSEQQLLDREQWEVIWRRQGPGFAPPDEESWSKDRPVASIDWYAAVRYCDWRSRREGAVYRLPNELLWEKLARGVDGRICAWGQLIEPSWAAILGSSKTILVRAPISSFPEDESVYGVRHTVGNVREWCANVWRRDGPPVEDGRLVFEDDASLEGLRAARGGAAHSMPELARAAARFAADPRRTHPTLGFRLVRSLEP